MKYFFSCFFCLIIFTSILHAQEEKPAYFQIEPYDDSLFVKIQGELFIEPADPKAEIIVDIRDVNNQTITIKSSLYPFFALSQETRANVLAYPYKINLDEKIHYASVFTRIVEKINPGKLVSPPSSHQISPSLSYINPFLQVFGGERFGVDIKNDIGISFGFGTPYSGPAETDFVEANFHLLGFRAGLVSTIHELVAYRLHKPNNQHTMLFGNYGFQIGYIIPFGNFFEVGWIKTFDQFPANKKEAYAMYDTLGYQAKLVDGDYVNWEMRYPLTVLGSTRAKVYGARYLNEWHFGFSGRELSLAGSTFDFRFDAMTSSDNRPQIFTIDILVQKIFGGFGFSALALGPSAVFSTDANGDFGMTTFLFNARFKIGTSF